MFVGLCIGNGSGRRDCSGIGIGDSIGLGSGIGIKFLTDSNVLPDDNNAPSLILKN